MFSVSPCFCDSMTVKEDRVREVEIDILNREESRCPRCGRERNIGRALARRNIDRFLRSLKKRRGKTDG